jgi:hypothetical protein
VRRAFRGLRFRARLGFCLSYGLRRLAADAGRGDTDLRRSTPRARNEEGPAMKFNIEVDCTPLEARQFIGLPDVQPMQKAVMDKLQAQLMSNIEKVSPEALMQSWFSFDPKIAERFQDMFVTMAGLGTRKDKK